MFKICCECLQCLFDSEDISGTENMIGRLCVIEVTLSAAMQHITDKSLTDMIWTLIPIIYNHQRKKINIIMK